MPLSEQEQHLLDEMERHLMHNDADVVHAPRDGRGLSYRNLVYGCVLVLIGLGALLGGVMLSMTFIGVIGFVIMLGGAVLAVTPVHGGRARAAGAAQARPTPAEPSGSFMDRMNDRWDRRHDGH